MDSTVVLMLGTVAAGIFLGFILGRFGSRSDSDEKVLEAYTRGKEEAEVEKANLTVALGEELLKLRSGIHSVAQAYESTVRVMHERLGNSLREGYIGVPGGDEVQLSLQFVAPEVEGEEALPLTAVEDANIQSVRHSRIEDFEYSEEDEKLEDDVAATVVSPALSGEELNVKNGHANS